MTGKKDEVKPHVFKVTYDPSKPCFEQDENGNLRVLQDGHYHIRCGDIDKTIKCKKGDVINPWKR